MLQQILKDMYIDPDVLNALNEDQKKTLFLKMRQEQVRRWKEREEKQEGDGGNADNQRAKAKKANGKSVSWMLGRDGDVAVIVIGEVDELKSKFIGSGLADKKAPNPQNNTHVQTILKSKTTTEAARSARENPPKAQTGVPPNSKGKSEAASAALPLTVSVSEHSSSSAPEKTDATSAVTAAAAAAAAAEEKSIPQPPVCSRPPARTSPVSVRPAFAKATPGPVNTRPSYANLRQTGAASSPPLDATGKADGETTSPKRGASPSTQPEKVKDEKATVASAASVKAAPEEARSLGAAPACAGRGRVAQLMKTFSQDNAASPPPPAARGVKPPLPTKPGHLRGTATPSVR